MVALGDWWDEDWWDYCEKVDYIWDEVRAEFFYNSIIGILDTRRLIDDEDVLGLLITQDPIGLDYVYDYAINRMKDYGEEEEEEEDYNEEEDRSKPLRYILLVMDKKLQDLEKRSSKGCGYSTYKLFELWDHGMGKHKRDKAKAARYLKKASDIGYFEAVQVQKLYEYVAAKKKKKGGTI